ACLGLARLINGREAAVERSEQRLGLLKRFVVGHGLGEFRRALLKRLELGAVGGVGLAPLLGVGGQRPRAFVGFLDTVLQARMVGRDLGRLVVALVDHLLEERAELFWIPTGVGVELESIFVGLGLVLAGVAHADELPGRKCCAAEAGP